jgi:adenylate kinase
VLEALLEDVMRLFLIGGIQGVGKSTLLSALMQCLGGEVELLNPGQLFRQYIYGGQLTKTTEEVEELIADAISNASSTATILGHWHFAVNRPNGQFIPQISWSKLEKAVNTANPELITLVLIEAPPDVIQARRQNDYNHKKRALRLEDIMTEAKQEEEFLERHRILLERTLGPNRVIVRRITNVNLPLAVTELERFVLPTDANR